MPDRVHRGCGRWHRRSASRKPSLTFTLTSIAALFRNAFQRAILQPPVKTAPRTGMAGGTGRFHLHPDRILIAVDKQLDQLLDRSEEHTSELPSLMRISYAVLFSKKKNNQH